MDDSDYYTNGAAYHHSHKYGFGLLDSWRLVNTAKVNTAKVNTAKVNTAKVNTAKVNTVKVNTAKVNTAKLFNVSTIGTSHIRLINVIFSIASFWVVHLSSYRVRTGHEKPEKLWNFTVSFSSHLILVWIMESPGK